MAVQMLGIKTKFTDDQGRPLVGGKVHAYFAGTTTYQDTFKDPDMTIVNTNPIILDDSGSADVYLNGSYRIRIFDKNDVLIEEQDGVTQSANGEITTAKGEIIGLYGAVLNSLTNEVKRAVAAEKTIADSLTSETTRAKSAESALQSSIVDETTRAKKAESNLSTGLAKEVSDRESEVARLDEADAVLQAQINSVGGGKLAYKTYAEMIADKSNIAEKSSIDIIADTDDKNGTYLYDGTNFVKSQYDLEKLIRAKVQNTFGTYAQMVASNLSDGAYALVADDTVLTNNGLYYKENGEWRCIYSLIQYKGLFTDIDLDTITTSGLYLVVGDSTNRPANAPAVAYKLDVRSFNDFVLQELIDNSDHRKTWRRAFRAGQTGKGWVVSSKTIATRQSLGEVIVGENLKVSPEGVLSTQFKGVGGLIDYRDFTNNFLYRGVLSSPDDDLNSLRDTGTYVITSTDVKNRPKDTSPALYLSVVRVGSSGLQTLVEQDGERRTFIRRVQEFIKDKVSTFSGTAWVCLNTSDASNAATESKLGSVKVGANLSITQDGVLSASSGGGNLAFAGKKLVCFGDSITEFKNYPALIKNRLGLAEAYNVGFGGCMMSAHWIDEYREMCMFRLADMIALNDYTPLTNAANKLFTERRDDNRAIAQRLASIDFNTVDYVTIFYGTNDFNEARPIGTIDDMTADGGTVMGSLNYSIKRLQETYPHLKILIATPIYRARSRNGGVNGSDDSPNRGGGFLFQYVDAIIEVAKLNKVPVIDMLRESCINKYTASLYLNPDPDGVHLTDAGAQQVADKLSAKLSCTY